MRVVELHDQPQHGTGRLVGLDGWGVSKQRARMTTDLFMDHLQVLH